MIGLRFRHISDDFTFQVLKSRRDEEYILLFSAVYTSFNHVHVETVSVLIPELKPIFHMATLFARREAKTRIRLRDWLKLAGEKIRREQVGSVPTFCLFARTKSPSGK